MQLSPEEKAILDERIEAEKKANPLITRNRFLRNFIGSLKKG